MTRFQRLRAWMRRPDVLPWTTVFFWLMTAMNVIWGFQDVGKRFDSRAKIQAARMSCEAKGGFYGSEAVALEFSERCFEPPMETALADR